MDSFFFHAKGGQELNWRNVSQKKSDSTGFSGKNLRR
jgi:hypothetical protein